MPKCDRDLYVGLVLSIVLATVIVVSAPMMFHVGQQDLVLKITDFQI